MDPKYNHNNQHDRESLHHWIGEKITDAFDHLKEGFYHITYDIKERLDDLKDEYNQVHHPAPRIIRAHIIKKKPNYEEDSHEKSNNDEETSWLCGIDCASLCRVGSF